MFWECHDPTQTGKVMIWELNIDQQYISQKKII